MTGHDGGMVILFHSRIAGADAFRESEPRLFCLFLAALPFLRGYRLGPRMPYRVGNHFRLFVLFAIPLMLALAGSWSFGGSLALLVSFPAVLLIIPLVYVFEWLAFGGLDFAAGGWFALPAAVIGLALYTWILTLIDRPLIRQIKTITERSLANGQRKCECE